MNTAPDSSLHLLRKLSANKMHGSYNRALYALLMTQALDKNDSIVDNDSLISIATDYFDDSDPVHAGYAWFYHSRTAFNRDSVNEQAQNLLKAQEYADMSGNINLSGAVSYEKATMYFNQRQYRNSLLNFKTAADYFKRINDKSSTILSNLYIGYSYLYLNKADSAQSYYNKAEKEASNIHNSTLISVVLRNIGTVYFQQGDYPKALRVFYSVPFTANSKYDSNKYYLIANVHIKTNKLDSAKYYLRKVTDLHEIAPDYYRLWQTIAGKENNKTKALYYANKVSFAIDSLYKKKLEKSFAGFEKKYKYQSLQIANQNLTIKNKQRGFLLLLALLTVSIFSGLFLFWRLKAKKNEIEYQKDITNKKQKLLEIEQEKTEKERENNALLERQLKLQSILLLNLEQHRNHSAKQTGLWVKKKNGTKSVENKVFNEELLACMDMEYNNISQRLKETYPELSANDIITCCMMLAGFQTGMIASVLNVQNESVFTRRFRIRKKLKLEESEKLEHFLEVF
ncbi:MAG: tetratricopeptide repeat protein [Paludibacter sp.]